jgi:hypothetical protein
MIGARQRLCVGDLERDEPERSARSTVRTPMHHIEVARWTPRTRARHDLLQIAIGMSPVPASSVI